MALRAGYYGIKKIFAKKINDGAIPTSASPSNPLVTNADYKKMVDYNNLVGVKNILPPDPRGTYTNAGITFVVNSNGSVVMNGTTTATAVMRYSITLQPGSYYIWGYVDSSIWCAIWDGNTYIATCSNGEPAILNVANVPMTVQFTVRVGHPNTVTNKVIYPMITYAGNPDVSNKYVPYAMTNSDLTARTDDLKVDVNGILTAASESNDFTTFKSKLAALTPVTRSISLAKNESQEITEEPVKVTKKSTKKSNTKNEEV